MAFKKNKVEPTFEERLTSARTTAAAAVSSFELVALDLEQSVQEKREIVADITFERARLEDAIATLDLLASEASAAARAAEVKAANIRALVSA